MAVYKLGVPPTFYPKKMKLSALYVLSVYAAAGYAQDPIVTTIT